MKISIHIYQLTIQKDYLTSMLLSSTIVTPNKVVIDIYLVVIQSQFKKPANLTFVHSTSPTIICITLSYNQFHLLK